MSWFGYVTLSAHTLILAAFLFITYHRASVLFRTRILEYIVAVASMGFGVLLVISLLMVFSGHMSVALHREATNAIASIIGMITAIYVVNSAILSRFVKRAPSIQEGTK